MQLKLDKLNRRFDGHRDLVEPDRPYVGVHFLHMRMKESMVSLGWVSFGALTIILAGRLVAENVDLQQ